MDELSSLRTRARLGGRCRLAKVISALAIVSGACVGEPTDRSLEPPPSQELLATQIRTITTGDSRPEQQAALRHIATIEPGAVEPDLRTAMAEAFTFTVLRGGSRFEDIRRALEDLLSPLFSTDDLAAALSGIPSRPGPTAEETTAALLAAGLSTSEVSDTLRAAMSHAVSGIARNMYPYRLHSSVLVQALAELFTDEELTRLIGSIATVPLAAAQVAAIQVALHHWGPAAAPKAQDPPSRELRSAMLRAVGRLAEIESAEASELQRLEASGDLVGQREIRERRLGRGLLRGPAWGQGLARVFDVLGDTVVSPALAAAVPGLSLVPFGEAAIQPAVRALRSRTAHRELMRSILSDLARIAAEPMSVENGTVLRGIARGFLSGEVLREKGIADRHGRVFEPAIDLALALEDPSLSALVRRLASAPGELVRVGMVPRSADDLAWRVRERIDWSLAIRSPEQLIAVLRTIPSSPRPTLPQREAAVQLEAMPAEEIGEELRSAMIEAWAHTHMGAGPAADRWYHVRTPLANVLVADYSPTDVVSQMGALMQGERGPEQDLAIEVARRWRDEAPEDVRVALIEALEYLNRVGADTGRGGSQGRREALADAVDFLAESRAVPALVRAGYPMVCATTGPTFSELAAEALARSVVAESAPPRIIEKGLTELGIKSAGGGFGRWSERTQAWALAAASLFLEGGARPISAAATVEDRVAILKAAIYLAVATADEPLSRQVNRLATDATAVEALGLERTEASEVNAYAGELLAARPLMGLWDC